MNQSQVFDFNIATPGKVILYGEHSVVYGKTALAASVNLKTVLKLTTRIQRAEPTIVLDFPCMGFTHDFRIKSLFEVFETRIPLSHEKPQRIFCLNTPESIDFERLLEKAKSFIQTQELSLSVSQENSILSFLCLFWGMFWSVDMTLPTCYIRVTSELDIGAGMGSSTAFNISLAAAFLQLIRRTKLSLPNDTCDISKRNFKSFKYWNTDLSKFEKGELDLISRWGHLGDKIMHGNPSGIDNAVCTYGSVIEFKRGSHENNIKIIPDTTFLKILLVNSKVPRNTKILVSRVALHRDRFTSVVDPILQAMDHVALTAAEVLRHMSQLCNNHTNPNSEAVEKTLGEEIRKLEELIDFNQKLLEALGVSHDTLEHICRIARIEGLHGKLTGAGGGGYAFVMLPFQGFEKQVCAVRMSFERHHFPVQEVTLGGPGVTLTETIYSHSSMTVKDINEPSLVHSDDIIPHLSSMLPSSDHEVPPVQTEQEIIEEEMDEWPWPFDLRELVKSMYQSQIQEDLQYDEIAVPLRNLCAVNVPNTLPQWMYKVTNFQDQISPAWTNALQGQTYNFKPEEGVHDTRQEVNGGSKISQFDKYYDFIEDSIKSNWRETQIFGGSNLEFSSSEKLDYQRPLAYKKQKKRSKQSSTRHTRKSEVSVESKNVNEHCVIPKQASYREKLFGQLDRPAKWLKDQFPPYGGRQWTIGSKLGETAKQQIESLHNKHKKFLRNLQGGCEFMRK